MHLPSMAETFTMKRGHGLLCLLLLQLPLLSDAFLLPPLSPALPLLSLTGVLLAVTPIVIGFVLGWLLHALLLLLLRKRIRGTRRLLSTKGANAFTAITSEASGVDTSSRGNRHEFLGRRSI
jgi:hypothetical protein